MRSPDVSPLLAQPMYWEASSVSGALTVPAPGLADLWRIGLDGAGREQPGLAATLGADEIARAGRFRFERDRRRFILGRSAVRRILARYLATSPSEIRFETDVAGKPRLGGAHPSLVFSFSRTEHLAVLAVASAGRIGVDIERAVAQSDLDLTARQQFSPHERAELEALPAALRMEGFYRGWTAKEALVKATGEGLSERLPEISVRLDPRLSPGLVSGPPPYAPQVWRIAAFLIDAHTLCALALDGPIRSLNGRREDF